MEEAFYKELFEYNSAMNQKLILVFNQHPDKISEKSIKWLNHVLNAHHLWNNRVDRQEDDYGVWQVHSPGDLRDIDLKNLERSNFILAAKTYECHVNYVNSMGKAYTNSVKDILFHVINHSTYHRGQIAADFRANGIDPVLTDYIAFKR